MKLIIKLLSFIFIFLFVFIFAGCEKEELEIKLTFDYPRTMEVGERYELFVYANNEKLDYQDYKLTFDKDGVTQFGFEIIAFVEGEYCFEIEYKDKKYSGETIKAVKSLDVEQPTPEETPEEVKYVVTFDIDGEKTTAEVKEGEKAVKPADPVKEGYTFLGWYLGDTAYDFETAVTSDVTLVAKFEENKYSILFEETLFTNSKSSYTVYLNDNVLSLSEYKISFDNTNINIEDNFITFYDEGVYSYTIVVNDKVVLTGTVNVENKTINLTFDLGGGKCTDLPSEYDGLGIIVLPVPSNGDFQFCGWRDEANKLYYQIDSSVVDDLHLTASWMYLDNELSFEIYDAVYIINEIPSDFYIEDKEKLDEAIDFVSNISDDAKANVYNLCLLEKYQAEYDNQVLLVNQINYDINLLKTEKSKDLADEIVKNYLKVPENNLKYIEQYEEFTKLLLEVNDYDVDINKILPDYLTDMIYLPNNIDGMDVVWKTSDENLLVIENENGYINKAYQSHVKKEVELSIVFSYMNLEIEIGKKVQISPITYEDIVASPIAAYVNIGAMSHYVTYNGREEIFSQRVKDTLDLAYYSFAVPTSIGTVNMQGTFDQYYDAVMDLKNHGVRVLLVLGGSGTSKAFSDIAANEVLLNKFIDNLVDLLLKYNFDGVDIDWEYPGYDTGRETSVDKENYVTMFKMLKAKLDAIQDPEGTRFILSSAIPGTSWGIARYNVPGLNKYLDYVNIMSYDLNSSEKATHLSPIYSSSKDTGFGFSADYGVKKFVELGFDKSKLLVGAATYGKAYKINGTGITKDNVLGKPGTLTQVTGVTGSFASGTIYYYAIKELLKDSDYKVETEKTSSGKIVGSYIYNENNNIFITYESDNVFQAKYEYAIENGIGIMCWSLPEDATDTYINSVYYVRSKYQS